MSKKRKALAGGITDEMIIDFEANSRGGCLLCEEPGPEYLEAYRADDIPEGFRCQAYWCHHCGRGWREIMKFERIEGR